MAGQDAVLAFEGAKGARLETTPLYRRLVATLDAICPVLLVIDNLADVFSGNENNRSLAKHFVGILRGLAIRYDCTVLLLGHPSLSGLNSGSGMSGSTAWSNSVRSRLYLTATRDKTDNTDEEIDSDQRWLKAMKANYSKLAEPISLRWQDGRLRGRTPKARSTESPRSTSRRCAGRSTSRNGNMTSSRRRGAATTSPTCSSSTSARATSKMTAQSAETRPPAGARHSLGMDAQWPRSASSSAKTTGAAASSIFLLEGLLKCPFHTFHTLRFHTRSATRATHPLPTSTPHLP